MESVWLWRSDGIYYFNESCELSQQYDCFQFVSNSDNYLFEREDLLSFSILAQQVIDDESPSNQFATLSEQRFVIEFIRHHRVTARIKSNSIEAGFEDLGLNALLLGPLGGFPELDGVALLIGAHMDYFLTVWSHIQPDPKTSQSQRLLGALFMIRSICWWLTLLAFLIVYAYFQLRQHDHIMTTKPSHVIEWFDLVRLALKQDLGKLNSPQSIINLSDCKLAIFGWIWWMWLLTSLMESLIVVEIITQSLLIVDSEEQLRRTITEYSFKAAWLDDYGPVWEAMIESGYINWIEDKLEQELAQMSLEDLKDVPSIDQLLLIDPERCSSYVNFALKAGIDTGHCGQEPFVTAVRMFGTMLGFEADPKAVKMANRFGRRLLESNVWPMLKLGYSDYLVAKGREEAAYFDVTARLSHDKSCSVLLFKITPILIFFAQLGMSTLTIICFEWLHFLFKE